MALRMAAATLRDVARSACPSGQEHAEDAGGGGDVVINLFFTS